LKLREAGIKSGLTKKDNNGEYIKNTIIHPHRLRHSYAYNLLKQNIDIRYIKDALRHANISSTQIYTQLSKEDLKAKLQGIN
jgi:site-specific recombinase XerD